MSRSLLERVWLICIFRKAQQGSCFALRVWGLTAAKVVTFEILLECFECLETSFPVGGVALVWHSWCVSIECIKGRSSVRKSLLMQGLQKRVCMFHRMRSTALWRPPLSVFVAGAARACGNSIVRAALGGRNKVPARVSWMKIYGNRAWNIHFEVANLMFHEQASSKKVDFVATTIWQFEEAL